VVTHDRYFLERVCDVTYALLGDGSCVLLPGGVDQYIQLRRDRSPAISDTRTQSQRNPRTSNAATRQARKDLARLEQQIARLDQRITALHEQMTAAASDYQQLADLQRTIDEITANKDELELAWLEAAEIAG
jgi:ABC transport system ATP-binding/permease protein